MSRISVHGVTGFLKTSTALHSRLAAETRLEDREFCHVTGNRKKFLNLLERTRILVTSKAEGQHFKPGYIQAILKIIIILLHTLYRLLGAACQLTPVYHRYMCTGHWTTWRVLCPILPISWNTAGKRRYMYSVFRRCTECQFRESNPCRPLPVCGHFTMTKS